PAEWLLVGLQSLWHYRSAPARRSRLIDSLWISCEFDPVKLQTFSRLEEIGVSGANMTPRGGAGTATQNVLVAHELAVVFAERARRGAITGVRRVGAPRPFPNVAKHSLKPSVVS